MVRCWTSNVEHAEQLHGENSEERWAAVQRPGTCLLPDGHAGPHEFTFDGDIVVQFAGE